MRSECRSSIVSRRRNAFTRQVERAWLTCALLGALLFSNPLAGVSLRWRWSNPTPHGGNIVDMAYSAPLNLAVQVAERGQIYTSDDLAFWIPRESGTTEDLRAVAFLQNRILITGEAGRVLYADAPEAFENGTLIDGPTTDWLEAIAVSTNLAVAVGDYGAVYTTTNGAHWKRQNSGVTEWLLGAAFGEAGFVAVGERGRIITSPNGTNWTRRVSGTQTTLNRVSFYDGHFVAVGSNGVSYTSAAGVSWAAAPTGASHPLWHAGGNNNAQIVLGQEELRLQESGASVWIDQIELTNGPPSWTYYSPLGFNDYFLVAGRSGMMVEGFRTNSSPYFWRLPSDSVRHLLFDVCFAGNLYVAVGDQATLLSSGNGIDWSLELPPNGTTSTTFLGVGGTTNFLVAAGDTGAVIVSPNTYTNVTVTNIVDGKVVVTNQLVSTLGVIWHALPLFSSEDLQGVAFGHGLYLITGGHGKIFTSSDGMDWTPQSAPATEFLSGAVAWPGGFIASGDQGTLLSSPDGTNWTGIFTGTTNWIYRVRYAGDRLIGLGQHGILLTSDDGEKWQTQNSGADDLLQDVVYIDGCWFAVGFQGTVLASSNCVVWNNIGAITHKDLFAAATDGAQLIAVGAEGAILRSQIVPDTNAVSILGYSRILNGDHYDSIYLFGGQPDQQFTLDHRNEFDTNSWVTGPRLEFFDSSGTFYYIESIPASKAPTTEFYRSSLLSP